MPDISQLQSGNKVAFEAIYWEYHTRVYSFMWRYTRDVTICEELVQEVFVKLWASRASLNTNISFTTQLFQVAKTVFIDNYRRNSRRVRYVDMSPSIAEETVIQPGVRDHAMMQHISTAIDRLPPVCREVFRLGKIQGLSYPEIARQLSISPKTVEGHMSKALKFLRHRLGGLMQIFL
jgi:RNA polymerase sigma-70 factor (family 1)